MKVRIALLVVAALAALSATGVAVAGKVMAPKRGVQKITVTMVDFKFRFSKPTSKWIAGKTTFTVMNKGKSIHDFDIVRVKNMPFIAPGKKFTFTVNLKPGTWRYVCTVPRHDQLGMVGNVTVKSAA
jgi:uncharacterized cupredoxin-like copper-binding protein